MIDFHEQRPKILGLIQEFRKYAQENRHKDVDTQLNNAAEHLAQGKLTVVIAGNFKQGKSSLINALLNENDLFPVDVEITTNLVSTITFGATEKIQVILGEPGNEKIKQIGRDEIADYVTEQKNKNNQRKARLLTIESPNQQLKNGLILVDTPGIGSALNREHTAITYAFIPNADTVIFVSDAHSPLTVDELDFVKMIAEHTKDIIHVVTKIDVIKDYNSIVESNRQKLSEVLKLSADEIRIVSVSSLSKLKYLKYQDKEDLEDSNFKELESELWKLLSERRGVILLSRALSELHKSLIEIKGPLHVELKTLEQADQEEIEELKNRLESTSERYNSLLERDADWLDQLRDGLTKIRDGAKSIFYDEFNRISRYQSNKYMDDARLLESPEQIAELLEVDMDAVMSKLGKYIGKEAANLHAEIEEATELNLNKFEIGSLSVDKKQLSNSSIEIKKAGWWSKTLTVTRNGTWDMTAGGTIGGLVGGTVGGILGSLFGGVGALPGAWLGAQLGSAIGSIAGATHGVKKGLAQVRDADKTVAKKEISDIIMPFLDETKSACSENLDNTITKMEKSMKDDLKEQIRRERKTVQETLDSIKKARSLSKEKAEIRSTELRARLQNLNQIEERINQIAEQVAEENPVYIDEKTLSASSQSENTQSVVTNTIPEAQISED